MPLADSLRMGWCRLFPLVVSGGAGDCSRSADAGIRPGSCQKHGRIPTEATDCGRTPHARWDILGSDYGLSIALKWSFRGGPGRGPAHYVPLFRPRRDFPLILNLRPAFSPPPHLPPHLLLNLIDLQGYLVFEYILQRW